MPSCKSTRTQVSMMQFVNAKWLQLKMYQNEEVKALVTNAIGPYQDLLTIVKSRKLKWYGHVTRSKATISKTILQGTVPGGRKRGRQKKRWEDNNIAEWTGMKLSQTLRKAEDRKEWRKVTAASSLTPQRAASLRDR